MVERELVGRVGTRAGGVGVTAIHCRHRVRNVTVDGQLLDDLVRRAA
jgi:hypothetical protein